MKKLITLILTLFTIFTTAHASDEISVFIEGQRVEFDQPPVIIDGRTLVPMRALFEALGANVYWEEETKTVFGSSLGISVYVTIDENVMFRNTCEIDLDVPARIINGRTMIPLRVVSEAFGMQVIWDNQSRTINLSSLGNIKELHWNDDYVYFGETLEGEAYGYGILYKKPDYEVTSIGFFNSLESSYMIKGSAYFDDGSYYTGEFKDSRFNGLGTYVFPDGEKYMGEWKDGKLNGEAVCYYADGGEYTGMFVNGEKCGQGTYLYSDGSVYEGEWSDNSENGQGAYISNSGWMYEGEWQNGRFNGYGTFTHPDGDKYVGEFEDGEQNGYGTYYYSNGDKYVGEHKDGTMHGQGTYYFANGQTLAGQWYDGEYDDTYYYSCKYNDCNNEAVENGLFCTEHKCKNWDCFRLREENRSYCYYHLCQNCYEEKYDTSSKYCGNCYCKVSGCGYLAQRGSMFCSIHLNR